MIRRLIKLFVVILLFSFCSSDTSDIVEDSIQTSTTSSTSSTSTTISVTSTTLPEILSEKLYASDLTIGDCFDYLGGEGYYFLADYYVTRVSCDTPHTYEIISEINYSSNEETIFGEDGVPNLEIYTACEKSYSEIFNRDIGGTSTYITWIGDIENFEEDDDYLCLVAVFDTLNGPQSLSTNYQTYFNNKTQNFVSVDVNELVEGDCFWQRRPDVDFYFYTEVDKVPCNEVHSHEVVKIYELPYEIVDEDEIYYWAFKTCYEYGTLIYPLFYFEDLENDGIRTIALFDEVAFATGDQTTVLCISYAYDSQDRSRAEHKNISFTDSFSSLYLGPDALSVPESGISLSCPYDYEIEDDAYMSQYIITLKSLDIPVKKIEIKYVDNDEEFIFDLTDIYAFHGFDKFNTSVAIYESWYFYLLSNRDLEAINNLSDGTDYLESVDLVVTDNKDNVYESSCDDE
ncbi:hypothetical protein N9U94_01895 [Acidimicrobiaceae bacterium]|nr:hypothetical protein [Acidimicrobiaceae bacterium]